MLLRRRPRLSTKRVNRRDRSLPWEELNRRVNCLMPANRHGEKESGERREANASESLTLISFRIRINRTN